MVTKRLSKNFEAFEDFSSLVVFLAENFRKFPKKSQNVTIYGVTIYGSRLYSTFGKSRIGIRIRNFFIGRYGYAVCRIFHNTDCKLTYLFYFVCTRLPELAGSNAAMGGSIVWCNQAPQPNYKKGCNFFK